MKRLRRARACGAAMILATPLSAAAEVKEYQIRRMLVLRTECQVTALAIDHLPVAERDANVTERFFASCGNVSHYPDGVEILCPDSEDEYDCNIVTKKRTFPHLRLPE